MNEDTMPLMEQIHRFIETQWLLLLEWLNNSNMFGSSIGRYALLGVGVILVLVGAFFFFRFGGRLFKLYALTLTPKARRATVMSHVDGDTVRVSSGRFRDKGTVPVRLIGIDTPESRRSLYMEVAPFGKRSAAYTKKRLPKGCKVFLVYDQTSLDKFGRQLAYLYTSTGEFFNASLVKEGYAWADRHPPNLKHAAYFDSLQVEAQKRRRGLWTIYTAPNELCKNYEKTTNYKTFLREHGLKNPVKSKISRRNMLKEKTRATY